jgi:membrane peptidoglycan carboxypeptidase
MRRRVRKRSEAKVHGKGTKTRSRLLMAMGVLFLLLILAGGAVAGGGTIYAYNQYNEIANDVVPPAELIANLPRGGARIYDRNGELMYEFVDEFTGLRRPVPIEEISPWLISATISVEDPSFYENDGLNRRGLARAALENLTPYGGDFLEGSGGSSITQQLAKNVYIPFDERSERSIDRKVTEMVIALELTNEYTKDQILSWYLNSISYGGIYTGIEAASQGYFGKTATELTLAEAALLAGIPQSPALYYPFKHINTLTGQLVIGSPPQIRQHQVLDLMVLRGAITPSEAEGARSTLLEFKPNRFDISAPHFVLGRVAEEIRARFGNKALVSDGLEVTTTLDMNLQREAERLIQKEVLGVEQKSEAHNGAFVSMDVTTGQILAWVGSRDYFRDDIEGRNDNAIAPNSPGSTLKPFTFMTAFMQGWGTGTGIIDAPYTLVDPATGEDFSPRDPISTFQGPMTAANALGNSLNITAIKAIEFAGVGNTINVLKQVGHTALDNPAGYGPALTLGGGEVTLQDQVISYGTIAAGGVMRGQEIVATPVDPGERTLEPIALLKVTDADGKLLYEFDQPDERRVVASEFTSLVTSILSDGKNQCLTYGVCSALSLPIEDGDVAARPSAAKTGTSEPYADSREIGETWTLGYTPYLVSGVWIGNSDNAPMVDISSAGASLTVWKEFMVYASKQLKLPKSPFFDDPSVVEREVCWPSGRLPTDICPQIKRYTSLYASTVLPQDDEDLPDFEDGWWQLVGIDTRTELLATEQTPASFVADEVRLVLPEDEIEDWEGLEAWAAQQGILSLLAPRDEVTTDLHPVQILSPRPDEKIAGRYVVLGRAASLDFTRYTLEWGRGLEPVSWIQVHSSAQPTISSSLGSWDTLLVPNGVYTLRVLLDDQKLGVSQYQVAVQVDNGDTGVNEDIVPVVQITNPIEGSLVNGDLEVRGTASSALPKSILVEVGSSLSPTDWIAIDSPEASALNNRLALWDTTSTEDGIYTIRVTLTDEVFGVVQAAVYVVVRNKVD